MRAFIIAGTLAIGLTGCSGPETREGEPWGSENPEDSSEAFDRRLKQKRLEEAESMERTRAQAARLAAERGKAQPEVSVADASGNSGTKVPAPVDRKPCPPVGTIKYTCRCAGGSKPSWSRSLGPAWKKQDGYWYAVGKGPAGTNRRMASDRAYNRALAKIALALKDQPDFGGLSDNQVKAFLTGAESREVHFTPEATFALARYKAGPGIPGAIIKAKCPKAAKVPYACDCPAGKDPAWLDLQAWRGGDGYAYAAGTSPGTSQHPSSRALNRARRNLMRFLSGLTIQVGRSPSGGRSIKSWSTGNPDSKRVERVTEQDHGKGKAVLLRFWIGE